MPLVEHMRYLILAAQRQGERSLVVLFRELDVTPSQAEALRVIADNAPLSLKELGERLICEGGSPSRLTSSLIQKGYVTTSETKKDRRVKILILTERGAKLVQQITLAEQNFYEQYTAKVTPSTLAALTSSLQQLIDDPHLCKALELRGVTTRRQHEI